jgi:hypothetical protein
MSNPLEEYVDQYVQQRSLKRQNFFRTISRRVNDCETWSLYGFEWLK